MVVVRMQKGEWRYVFLVIGGLVLGLFLLFVIEFLSLRYFDTGLSPTQAKVLIFTLIVAAFVIAERKTTVLGITRVDEWYRKRNKKK